MICAMPFDAISQPLPGTAPLEWKGDLGARMVEGIDAYLMREIAASRSGRERFWHRDTSSPAAYLKSIEPNREHFKKIIGLIDPREPPHLDILSESGKDAAIAK